MASCNGGSAVHNYLLPLVMTAWKGSSLTFYSHRASTIPGSLKLSNSSYCLRHCLFLLFYSLTAHNSKTCAIKCQGNFTATAKVSLLFTPFTVTRFAMQRLQVSQNCIFMQFWLRGIWSVNSNAVLTILYSFMTLYWRDTSMCVYCKPCEGFAYVSNKSEHPNG